MKDNNNMISSGNNKGSTFQQNKTISELYKGVLFIIQALFIKFNNIRADYIT
jgi:hypothetical protein